MAVVERYAIRGGRAGHDRLALLAEARRDDTRELLELAGVRTGMACLDLGCGGGEVSFDIARLVGPAGRVVGLDMDEVKLDLVEDRLASGEEVRRAIARLAAFTSEADTVVSGPRVFQLWRQRPRGA